MTVLDHEFTGKIHFPLRLFFAILAMAAVILFWITSSIGTPAPEPVALQETAPCATDAPGCEMLWLQKTLTDMENPILVLSPEAR